MKKIIYNIPPQLQQLITLSIVLIFGKITANIYLSWIDIVSVILSAIMIEHLFIYIKTKHMAYFSYSALSTAIGVMLMMVTPHIWIYLILVFIALWQKNFLRIRGRHFFNPSNFALMMGLILFYKDSHIVLGQLGDELWLGVLVVLLGFFILIRVERWLIPIAFTVAYLWLEYIFVVQYDPVLIMEEVLYRFYSVSFLVFVLFMLTDPITTPSKAWQQIIFAFLVAMIAVLLDRLIGFRVQHLFMALFLLSTLIPLLMLWNDTRDKKQLYAITSIMLFLAVSAIIFIEIQPPYYFDMEG